MNKYFLKGTFSIGTITQTDVPGEPIMETVTTPTCQVVATVGEDPEETGLLPVLIVVYSDAELIQIVYETRDMMIVNMGDAEADSSKELRALQQFQMALAPSMSLVSV